MLLIASGSMIRHNTTVLRTIKNRGNAEEMSGRWFSKRNVIEVEGESRCPVEP